MSRTRVRRSVRALVVAMVALALMSVPLPRPAVAANIWSGLGTGMNWVVNSLAVDSTGLLYAGGYFTTAGGTSAAKVAKWNGSSWSALGSGVSAGTRSTEVTAVAIDGSNNLYVGGDFTLAGGGSANYIAKWNGSSWSALGTGMSGIYSSWVNVYAIAVDGSGNVYAGGDFQRAGGTTVNNIAKWNGTSWTALGTGTNGIVRALTFDANGNLYAGGNFTTAGGTTVNRIAKWNGTSWSALTGGGATGLNERVNAITTMGSKVYVGGWFTATGSGATQTRYMASYDTATSTWAEVGTGFNGQVRGLTTNGTTVTAVGQFAYFGGTATPVNHVAQWNGSTWSTLGDGTDNDTYAVSLSGSTVYVGGDFANAGGATATRIAQWAPQRFTVTYNGNGNSGGAAPTDASSPYVDGTTVTVLGNTGSLTRTNYAFTGWNTAADGTGVGYAPAATFAIAANTTLYAQWTPTYTVTYNGNGNDGGVAPTDAASPYNSGTTVTVLGNTGSLTRDGYSFAGWNTAAGGAGTDYDPGATFAIVANTTLYARWSRNSSGGGSSTPPSNPPKPLGSLDPIVSNGHRVPGEELTTVDGRRVPVTVQADSTSTGLDAAGTGFSMHFAAFGTDGAPSALGAQGTLRLRPDGRLQVSGSGFRHGSPIRVYLMSDPTLLGTMTADAEGRFDGTMAIPATTIPGTHTVQVNAYTPENDVRSMSLGVDVMAADAVPTTLGTRVLFRYRSTALTAAARSSLRALVQQVPTGVSPTSVVVGALRATGATAADRALARARAAQVSSYLRRAGLTGPIAVTVTKFRPVNKAADRRVTVTIHYGAAT